MNLRNRKFVLISLAVISVALFGIGLAAGYLARNQQICPGGKSPLAQRSDVIGPTEYRCPGGLVVSK